MNYILVVDLGSDLFRPMAFTRASSDLFAGCDTKRERWNMALEASMSSFTYDYLQKKFPLSIQKENILINGRLLPSKSPLKEISNLSEGEVLVQKESKLTLSPKLPFA